MDYFLLGIALVAGYAILVLLVEVSIWRFQPNMDGGVTLKISRPGKPPLNRKLFGFRHDEALYVSSNHWFRSWYWAALENPQIEVTVDGVTQPFIAQAVTGDAHRRVADGYSMGFALRLLCGFAPSRFLELRPQ